MVEKEPDYPVYSIAICQWLKKKLYMDVKTDFTFKATWKYRVFSPCVLLLSSDECCEILSWWKTLTQTDISLYGCVP